jgi:hypothetical protein
MKHSHVRIASLLEDDWVHKNTFMTASLHYFKMTGFIKQSHDRIVFYEPSHLLKVKRCGHQSVL